MTGMDLMLALEFIGDDLIEAAGTESTQETQTPHRASMRRMILTAAVIAVILMLVGCAAAAISLIFGTPRDMIAALYGKDAGYASAAATEATDPWKEGSSWTVPGYEKQPAEPAVAKELEKMVSPVGQSITDGENTLTVDAFLYDSVTQSGLITILWEHTRPLDLKPGYDGELGAYPVKINQYGRAYLIPDKSTDNRLAFTYYFRMDKRSGNNLCITFPNVQEQINFEALDALRKEEVPKIRQRLQAELTAEAAAEKCREIFGFSGYTGEYDDYYYLAAYEFDSTHADEYIDREGRDLTAAENALKNTLSPQEALAQLETLWGKEYLEETLDGRGQEEAQELAYFFLAKQEYQRTHTENKIFVTLSQDMKLPNRHFAGGNVLVNTLSIQINHSEFGSGDSPKEVILHMKDGSEFVVINALTENTLFNRVIEHGDVLYMLNSAINVENIQSVEIDGRILQ